MSDKTEEGQVDINVVKAALLKLLQDIEEKPDREDIKSLIHDIWKSIQLENTSLTSDSKVGVFKKSGFGKEMKTKGFNKKGNIGVVKEDENELYKRKVKSEDSKGNSKVGAVEKHEKTVTYKKEKFGLGFNEKGNIGVVKEDKNELYNWKVRNKDSIGNSKVGAVEKHEKAVTYKKEKFKMSKENSESKQQEALNAEALEDLHKETSSILVESELDEEELLDCRDNKPAHFSNTREGISDNLSDVDEAENLLIQPPSSFLNRDDNVVNEVNFNIQTSNDQVDSEENQFDEDNYEMPIATIVNDEEVALPHAEPAQIDDDIIIVDAKAVVPWYRQEKFYAGVLVVSAAIVSAVIWGPQDSTSTAIVPTFVPSSTPTISFQPSFSSVRQGLDDFYESTSGDNWGKRWLNDDVSWCSWFGIECNNYTQVISLQLNDYDLRGSISSSISSLGNLIEIDLGNNQLTGTIPLELGLLSNLESLQFHENQFNDRIPTEFGLLSNLEELHLYDNQINNTIPSELGLLSRMEKLSLSKNKLTGTIPTEFGLVSSLVKLNLSDNQLNGTILSEFGLLSSLMILTLSGNQATGTIPSELGLLSRLESLSLGVYDLIGTIPSELGLLSNLKDISFISDTNITMNSSLLQPLSGLFYATSGDNWECNANWLSFKVSWCNWYGVTCEGNSESITQISLDFNTLQGTIPSELVLLSNLKYLSLRNNALTSTIPSELGLLMNLARLNLQDNNQLNGSVPVELCNRIGDGSLSVMISGTNIENSCVLFEFYYSTSGDDWNDNDNWLDITISLCNWYGVTCDVNTGIITQIDLRYNNLQGSIPTSMSAFSGLQRLNLEGNALTGTIPSEVGLLSSLYSLDLDYNSLTGTIPSEVGLLSSLYSLDLDYYNALTGTIPSEVGLLSSLGRLDLDYNLLTGTIPSEVGLLSSLVWLDLDYNSLTGTIPSEVGLLSNMVYLVLDYNSEMNGTIPMEVCNLIIKGSLSVYITNTGITDN